MRLHLLLITMLAAAASTGTSIAILIACPDKTSANDWLWLAGSIMVLVYYTYSIIRIVTNDDYEGF